VFVPAVQKKYLQRVKRQKLDIPKKKLNKKIRQKISRPEITGHRNFQLKKKSRPGIFKSKKIREKFLVRAMLLL
jgi:hypothetical protein